MTPRLLGCALVLVLLACVAPAASAAVHLTPIADFSLPVHVAAPPGDPHRLFVVEQGGRIMEVRDGLKLATPFLDITSDVRSGGEQGLLSMAFAPDYATSRKFYVYYTAPRPGDGGGSVITVQEFQSAAGNPDAVDPASRRTILTVDHPTNGNHNGGQLQFGPDGQLYAGTGDGGSGNDPPNNAQNPNSQLGKLLRIDRVNGGASIQALGLRNPWRFSFDRQTGDLIIGDVGQNAFEEVDFTPAGTGAGLNYGWRCFEGFHSTGLSCPSMPGTVTPPVIEKDQSATGFCAIVGGYVVRDPALGALNGRYLYGDNCASEIRSAALVAPPARVTDDTDTGLRVNGLTSFGQDTCGHIYTASGAGQVSRIDGDTFTPCPGGGPAVRIQGKTRQRVVRQRGLRLKLSCSEACRLTVKAKVRIARSKKRYALRTVRRSLTKPAKVRLRLGPRGRRAVARALRHHRRVKIAVTVSATNSAGDTSGAGRTFRARR
jgi:glucose/arabinose dehydrogenase